MSVAILGLSTAQPSGKLTQQDAVAMAIDRCCQTDREARLLRGLYRRTRVEHRAASAIDDRHNGSTPADQRWAFYPPGTEQHDRGPTTAQRMQRYIEQATPLAVRASRDALAAATIDPQQITHLVTVSCTGFAAPGVDIQLAQQLGLPATVGRAHVGFMGCHGAFNALRVGQAMAESSPGAKVLVCSVELCSLHFAYGFDPQRVVANALFADGSAAAVICADENNDEPWRLAATSSCLMPDCDDAMTWLIRDHGFEMTLSPRVPELIEQHLRPWLDPWLAEHGLTVEQVGSWAIHPGGPRIIESVEAALGIADGTAEVSRDVLRECGNMSSATILFILERLRAADAARPCVALGFGPGLNGEAMLLV